MNRFADELSTMNRNMQKMWNDVNSKMDKMASDIEKRLTNKLSNTIDKGNYRGSKVKERN